MRKCLLLLLAIILTTVGTGLLALAGNASDAVIKADVTVSGEVPWTAEKYSIELKAADESNPMPEGSDGGTYVLIAEGGGKFEFPAISFKSAGIYKYTVRQQEGTDQSCEYDKTVYSVEITVLNNDKGGVDCYIATRVDGSGDKTDKIRFDNKYTAGDADPPIVPPVTKDKASLRNLAIVAAVAFAVIVGFGVLAVRKRSER